MRKEKDASIPKRINKLLRHFRVSKKTLAEMLRVSESTIKRWQKGIGIKRVERLPTLRKLEDLMELAEKTLSNKGIPRWYYRPLELLGQEIPIEFMIKNDNGIERVTELVAAIRWGFPS